MTSVTLAPYPGLMAAIAAGLLIGLERGWILRELPEGSRVAGFRTFGLIGLAGGISGLLSNPMAAVIGAAILAILVIGYCETARRQAVSATTTVAACLTFAIGMIAIRKDPGLALMLAAAIYILLSARRSMHALLSGLEATEIDAVARFALVSLIILPLLPDADFGPFGAWNPRRIWMVVVLVTGLSFAGYVVARRFGQDRGIMIVAFTGALVSSTAVTAEFARRLRAEPERRAALIAGISFASVVMLARVQILAAMLVPRAVPILALSLSPAVIVSVICALVAWRRQRSGTAAPVQVGNPFDFRPALMLAGLVAVLSLVARWALARFGGGGMALILGLTGMMDVDAAVMALAGLPRATLGDDMAGFVLAVPVLANMVIKGVMTMLMARGRAGVLAAFPLFASCVASAIGLAIFYPF